MKRKENNNPATPTPLQKNNKNKQKIIMSFVIWLSEDLHLLKEHE